MASSSFESQNKAALEYFIQMPVTKGMVTYLASKASQVIRCEDTLPTESEYMPTPPSTPPSSDPESPLEAPLPSMEEFITSIVQQSHVGVQTLMPALVYLAKLKQRLPPVAKGMRCTVHRIFLAALILAAKNLNDSSPKNKYWARYTTVPGYPQFGFSNSEVNLMEKQLLFLLDWDLNITNDDLHYHLEPFLAPIRTWQQRQTEKAMHAIAIEREMQQQQQLLHSHQYDHLTSLIRTRAQRVDRQPYDTPQSVSSYSDSSYSPYNARRRPYPVRSSSRRLPIRTPSLSPPTRTGSAASSYTSSSSIASSSPASSTGDAQHHHHQYSTSSTNSSHQIHVVDVENLPHLPEPIYTPNNGSHVVKMLHHPLSISSMEEQDKPSKKIKTSAGNIFSRFLGSAPGVGSLYAPRMAPVQVSQMSQGMTTAAIY